MNRDAAFWMIIGVIAIPAIIIGWLRGRATVKTYQAIYRDLKKSGIELSQSELKLLIRQLYRNPKAVLSEDDSPESRIIKEQHVRALMAYSKPLQYYRWILYGIGAIAVVSFAHLWPKK
ncbi:MAG: hypothetical protein JWR26_1053 [Pedosphaera sp.]|nr:hypothetical protein [Pedosphaera sp.]